MRVIHASEFSPILLKTMRHYTVWGCDVWSGCTRINSKSIFGPLRSHSWRRQSYSVMCFVSIFFARCPDVELCVRRVSGETHTLACAPTHPHKPVPVSQWAEWGAGEQNAFCLVHQQRVMWAKWFGHAVSLPPTHARMHTSRLASLSNVVLLEKVFEKPPSGNSCAIVDICSTSTVATCKVHYCNLVVNRGWVFFSSSFSFVKPHSLVILHLSRVTLVLFQSLEKQNKNDGLQDGICANIHRKISQGSVLSECNRNQDLCEKSVTYMINSIFFIVLYTTNHRHNLLNCMISVVNPPPPKKTDITVEWPIKKEGEAYHCISGCGTTWIPPCIVHSTYDLYNGMYLSPSTYSLQRNQL